MKWPLIPTFHGKNTLPAGGTQRNTTDPAFRLPELSRAAYFATWIKRKALPHSLNRLRPYRTSRCHLRDLQQIEGQRYWLERVLQEARQQLSLHQNQTRSWPAWQYQVALAMMALQLLLDTQVRERETTPYLSFASLKLVLA